MDLRDTWGGSPVAVTEALATVLAMRRLRDDDIAWDLLRADSAPVIAGLLGTHLAGEVRRMPVAQLVELIDDDLDRLRAQGEQLPRTAQGYCADWRAAGYLVRRPTDDARGETFELSAGALTAIRLLESLVDPRSTVTESRLASISEQLTRLAIDTDPNAQRRLAQLQAQRAELDAEIERVTAGDVAVLDAARALERVRDVLAQASELPSDFARVRASFEKLNSLLYEQLVESDDAQRRILDEVFRGVDLISQSEEGRSFGAFLRLVLDPERGSAFDRDVEQILDREFAASLSIAERRTLRRLMGMLKAEGAEIHDVISDFARGLRRYVQSQQYERDRVLRAGIREALAAGLRAAPHTKPYRDTSVALPLSSVPMTSVGAMRLHNPAELDAAAEIEVHAPGVVDWRQLREITRATEIDFDELLANIEAVRAKQPEPTIAEVLVEYPATQGVASVVGLLTLADSDGIRVGGIERVQWEGMDGLARAADIPVHRFMRRTG